MSDAAGGIYGALTPKATSPVVAGSVFGMVFYALAWGVAGPAAKVSPVLWRDSKSSIAQHGLIHLLFGVTTAVVAKRAARRL